MQSSIKLAFFSTILFSMFCSLECVKTTKKNNTKTIKSIQPKNNTPLKKTAQLKKLTQAKKLTQPINNTIKKDIATDNVSILLQVAKFYATLTGENIEKNRKTILTTGTVEIIIKNKNMDSIDSSYCDKIIQEIKNGFQEQI